MLEGLAERLSDLPRSRDQTLPALHLLHDLAGYLHPDGLEQVAAWVYVPKSELYAVASSYTEFHMAPPADGAVAVCQGLSCRIAGSDQLAADLRAAGRSVVDHECLFACAVAPVLKTADGLRGRASANGAGG